MQFIHNFMRCFWHIRNFANGEINKDSNIFVVSEHFYNVLFNLQLKPQGGNIVFSKVNDRSLWNR